MTWILGLIAGLISIAGVLAALGFDGYLLMLGSLARKRAGGDRVAQFAKSRWLVAGGTTAAGLLALWISMGGPVSDVIAILLAAGTLSAASKGVQSTHRRLTDGNLED
jgi:hypothetical protein